LSLKAKEKTPTNDMALIIKTLKKEYKNASAIA